MDLTKQEMSAKIIRNELALRKAITEGKRPHTGDELQPLRIENEILRCMYYGEDSPYCRRQFTK